MGDFDIHRIGDADNKWSKWAQAGMALPYGGQRLAARAASGENPGRARIASARCLPNS
jgi:hypothetical protein